MKNQNTNSDHSGGFDGVDAVLPTLLKGWRVVSKISSGRGGDLYQVASNGTDTA
jgi:hypothetical protein